MQYVFLVEPGYVARVGNRWHDHRILIRLEESESVAIYHRERMGQGGAYVGSYGFASLKRGPTPTGLQRIEWCEIPSWPLSLVDSSARDECFHKAMVKPDRRVAARQRRIVCLRSGAAGVENEHVQISAADPGTRAAGRDSRDGAIIHHQSNA